MTFIFKNYITKATLLILLLSVCGGLFAQIPTLKDMEQRLQAEIDKIAEQRSEKVDNLRKSYVAALLRFESTARGAGDLDGVQLARKEMDRVENEIALLPDSTSSHPDLARMQALIGKNIREFAVAEAQSLADLVAAVTRYGESTSATLTQQNNIEEALAWREWVRNLPLRPRIASTARLAPPQTVGVGTPAATNPTPATAKIHPMFQQRVPPLRGGPEAEFGEGARAYLLGDEPKATEKRVNMSTPSMQGSGSTVATAQLRLVDEENTLNRSYSGWSTYRNKAHLYVARIQVAPLPGKPLGRSLVVYDLFKRGTGSKREIIRTDSTLIPQIEPGQTVVVDSGVYAYETEKYRSSYSTYRYENSTADEFYGFVVSVFDETGTLYLQRSSDRALDDHARTEPPGK